MSDQQKQHPETGPNVKIIINGVEKEIHRGNTTVVEIKNYGNIPLADDLELIHENGTLELLPDDGRIVIKGGEKFVSHPKSGQSS